MIATLILAATVAATTPAAPAPALIKPLIRFELDYEAGDPRQVSILDAKRRWAARHSAQVCRAVNYVGDTSPFMGKDFETAPDIVIYARWKLVCPRVAGQHPHWEKTLNRR